MNDTEKQKIKEDFEKEFEDTHYRGAVTRGAMSDYWLSILDKTIKSKLEAVEGAVKEIQNKDILAGRYNACNEVLEIINKHK